jgi:DNA-binding FadR family transcriptional regulator
VFTPIKSRGLVDEVCGRIEQAVETGLLTSGQRLPNETELAAALGVSAVTAREALSQLRTSGLIRTARGRSGGSFIAENVLPTSERAQDQLRALTRLQITDLGLHYQAIAAACAGAAALRADAADVATLRSFIPAAGDDPLSWRLSLAEFLLEVAAIARSARLARELIRLQADLGALTVLPCADEAYRGRSTTILADITADIDAHRPAAAEAGAKSLIGATTDWLLAEQAKHC